MYLCFIVIISLFLTYQSDIAQPGALQCSKSLIILICFAVINIPLTSQLTSSYEHSTKKIKADSHLTHQKHLLYHLSLLYLQQFSHSLVVLSIKWHSSFSSEEFKTSEYNDLKVTTLECFINYKNNQIVMIIQIFFII